MTDWISRMDAVQACQVGPSDEWSRSTKSGYNQAATDCAMNILCIPAVQPDAAAIREAALHELADDLEALADDLCHVSEATRFNMHTQAAGIRNALVALIDKPAHVNETREIEHETRVMLAPDAALFRGPA